MPNPEDLLLAAPSACHMLRYLHLASAAAIVVNRYTDDPTAIGEVHRDGAGRFLRATLRPHIVVGEGTDVERAHALHRDAGRHCFIARSVNFPIAYAPTISILED